LSGFGLSGLLRLRDLHGYDPELQRRLNLKELNCLGASTDFVRRSYNAKRASWGLPEDTDTPTEHGGWTKQRLAALLLWFLGLLISQVQPECRHEDHLSLVHKTGSLTSKIDEVLRLLAALIRVHDWPGNSWVGHQSKDKRVRAAARFSPARIPPSV